MVEIRSIRVVGDIAYVPLTKGHEAIIDAGDVDLVAAWNWIASERQSRVYAVRGDYSTGKRLNVYMHRVIASAIKGLDVDHRDANGLNNRRHNLRLATRQQNQFNQRTHFDNKAGLKGVHWHKRDRRWCAQIQINRKVKHLGYYTTPQEAYAAYCKASAELHGEFGCVA